ncbi:hypothetical protein KIL84_020768 [Mauremys mutica]|uniref:Uncharacterized protein n=1 Tax=Mauremys mutica TaxID=74926 RepID=A0A9D3X649_9SAUR|nr:hypothetical protein KIL84_020768 [Mauremys mutica]
MVWLQMHLRCRTLGEISLRSDSWGGGGRFHGLRSRPGEVPGAPEPGAQDGQCQKPGDGLTRGAAAKAPATVSQAGRSQAAYGSMTPAGRVPATKIQLSAALHGPGLQSWLIHRQRHWGSRPVPTGSVTLSPSYRRGQAAPRLAWPGMTKP